MSIPDQGRILLALDTGIRETGWAVFHNGRVEATGAIAVPRRRGMSAAVKVEHLIKSLDGLAKQWQPDAVACCQPSGIGWRMTALELLDAALADWSHRHRLCLYAYTPQEVRTAIAGHPNVPRDQMGYAVMVRFGLIGQSKTTQEWEAIAVGHYHLTRWAVGSGHSSGNKSPR
jgi:Holliday junction resolvasome RuvABC endonuclease subunit